FTMVIHNGSNTLRTSNIYFNSPGNYFITTANCGQIPLTQFNELNVPCNNCQLREYPFPINLLIDIQSSISVTSLKQGGKYSIGCVLGDLAGRLTYVNIANDVSVQTFLQRDNVNATYFQVALSGTLQLASQNPDFKWFAFYVSRNANTKRPVQWVGDSIIYLDNDGNTVTDSSNASFVKILIQSLYDYNVSKNFTLLAKYQFVKGDRVRVYDDGDGNLFDTATYGDTIDVQVLGTDYNQAAINAGLLPPETNTFLDNTSEAEGIGLIMKYDSRFDRLKDKTGFWIELYSPSKTEDIIPFFEVSSFYPIINGEIAEFVGYSGSQPQYNFPQSFNLNFWDTYYLQRTILGKYYSHPFESPNITDDWGSNMISGGRIQVENKDAAQYWDGGDVIKSGGYGLLNELAMFREKERTSYGEYPYGEIVAAITKRNTIAFICTNDWFVVEYNMPYARVSNNQVVIANLDESLSFPKPKGGPMYGLAKEDIGTVVFDDDFFYWLDLKNTGFIRCDYNSAIDVTKTVGNEKGGLQSYLNKKLQFVNSWNASHETKDRFDAVCGLDMERGNIYLTFRPRRNNSTEATSFSSNRRFQDTGYQETFVYSTKYMGWMPCANFAPEAYASLRGAWANVEMVSFASGKPYYHNNTPNDSFLNYYGVQTEPVITAVANKDKEVVKILQALSQIINGSSFFFDQIYSTQPNSFSYIPPSFIKEKEKVFYSEVLRDMSSYPGIDPNELYRSMLHDGKRLFAEYFVIRMVQKYADLGKYFQLSSLNYLIANSHTTKP
ncbi:MAG: hypothetical protein KDC56_05575, partial [Flavobacteriaceae bacterium]|nr:hypothetical protein [Flavobacteriaceae bacterium]